MEKWDILAFDGEPTGETVTRGLGVLKDGQYHLVVHIWIVDNKKRVLIQQRSLDVDILPGKWAITGGSAVSGEDELAAARRELFEETGIKAEESELTLFRRYRGRNDFVYVYVLRKSIGLGRVSMQPEEVQAVKWVSLGELKKMVSSRYFHNYNYLNDLYEYIEKL